MNFLEKGINFIEVLTVLTIISFIILFALPSYQWLINRNLSQSIIDQLYSSLQFARQQAILHNIIVSICPRKNNFDCGNEWKTGLLIFIDPKGNGKLQDIQQYLRIINFPPNTGKIVWNRERPLLQFNGLGMLHSQNGSFHYCLKSDANSKEVLTVSNTGRVRIEEKQEKC